MSELDIRDPKALHEYLVRLAIEGTVKAASNPDADFGSAMAVLDAALRERMAQAAQAIACELDALEQERDEARRALVEATARHAEAMARVV
jgi:hypothetical protein